MPAAHWSLRFSSSLVLFHSYAVNLSRIHGESAHSSPTAAGLDSTNAANIVDILAELARGGVNVILTIHQPRPDVFRLMDTVLLMSGNGQVTPLYMF